MNASTQSETQKVVPTVNDEFLKLKNLMDTQMAMFSAHIAELHSRLQRAAQCVDQTNEVVEHVNQTSKYQYAQLESRITQLEKRDAYLTAPCQQTLLTPISDGSEFFNFETSGDLPKNDVTATCIDDKSRQIPSPSGLHLPYLFHY